MRYHRVVARVVRLASAKVRTESARHNVTASAHTHAVTGTSGTHITDRRRIWDASGLLKSVMTIE